MPSLLDHIRDIRRRRATHTSSSSSSRTRKSPLLSLSPLSPVEPHTPPLSFEISPSSRTSEHLIDRRIHPDIDSLLASPDESEFRIERPLPVVQEPSPRRSFYGLGGLSPSRPSPRRVIKRNSESSVVKGETDVQLNRFHDDDDQLRDPSFRQFPSTDLSSEGHRFPSIDSPERWSTFGRRHSRRNYFSQSQELIDRERSFYSRSEMSSIQTHSRSHSSGGFFGRKRKKKDSSASRPSSAKSANTFFNPNIPPQTVIDTSPRPRTGSGFSLNSPNSASADSASKPNSSVRSLSAKWSDAQLEASNNHDSSENAGSSSTSNRQANASSLLLPGDSPRFKRLPFTPPVSHDDFGGVDSPQTFGERTSAHRSAPDLLYTDSSPSMPSHPKITRSLDFDHQSNYNNLFSISHSNSSFYPPSSRPEPKPQDRDVEEEKSYSLRPLQRDNIPTLSSTTFGNVSNSGSSSFPSLSFTFGNPFRHSSNSNQALSDSNFQQQVYKHPKASHIFSLSTTQLGEQMQNKGNDTKQKQQHEGSKSANDQNVTLIRKDNTYNVKGYEQEDRRESAKWSAQQATEGAIVEPPHRYGWPAIVSREMVRISLEDKPYQRIQGTSTGTGNLDGITGNARALHVSNTSRQKSHHQHSKSDNVLSKPHSLLSLPPPPSSSSTAATTLAASPAPLLPVSAGNFENTEHFCRQRNLKTEGLSGSGDHLLPSPRRSRSLGDNHLIPTIISDTKNSGKENLSSFRSQSISKASASGSLRQRSKVSIVDGHGQTGQLSRMRTPSPAVRQEQHLSSILLKPPNVAVTAPTPEGSPGRTSQPSSSTQNTAENGSSALQVPSTNVTPPRSDKASGKRKAEESEDGSPPRQKSSQKVTTFAVQESRGTPRVSNSSHAPSSFNSYGRKRPRVSSSPMTTPDRSYPNSLHENRTPSRNSNHANAPHTTSSRPGSFQDTSIISSQEGAGSVNQKRQSKHQHQNSRDQGSQHQRRQSISQYSQASIPISAILSPHAPSIDRLSTFHMRDPRKPPPKKNVGWTLRFPSYGEHGSPMQAWCFWVGFLFPPIWWLAAFWSIPETRIVGGDTEKAVTVDDPQIERDARAWRRRCRIVSVLFFFTYAPVIILLAIFAPRQ